MPDRFIDLIPSFVAGTLPAPDARAVADHLASCPACRAELATWQAIAAAAARRADGRTVVLPAYRAPLVEDAVRVAAPVPGGSAAAAADSAVRPEPGHAPSAARTVLFPSTAESATHAAWPSRPTGSWLRIAAALVVAAGLTGLAIVARHPARRVADRPVALPTHVARPATAVLRAVDEDGAPIGRPTDARVVDAAAAAAAAGKSSRATHTGADAPTLDPDGGARGQPALGDAGPPPGAAQATAAPEPRPTLDDRPPVTAPPAAPPSTPLPATATPAPPEPPAPTNAAGPSVTVSPPTATTELPPPTPTAAVPVIAGTVYDADAAPMAGARVVAEAAGGGTEVVAETDALGRYTLAVAAGSWLVHVEAAGHALMWRSGKPTPLDADAIDAAAASAVDFYLEPAANWSIRGTVVDASGSPVARALVLAAPPDRARGGARRPSAAAYTDASGNYFLPVPTGAWLVATTLDWRGSALSWWGGDGSLSTADAVPVGDDAPSDGIDLTLQP